MQLRYGVIAKNLWSAFTPLVMVAAMLAIVWWYVVIRPAADIVPPAPATITQPAPAQESANPGALAEPEALEMDQANALATPGAEVTMRCR